MKTTWEHAVVGNRDIPFCQPGDSGALVTDEFGIVVGLLPEGVEGTSVSYLTHSSDLVERIKEVTGAVDVRVTE